MVVMGGTCKFYAFLNGKATSITNCGWQRTWIQRAHCWCKCARQINVRVTGPSVVVIRAIVVFTR